MAPSNLSQTFVVNNVTMIAAGTAFNTSAATANASKFGMYDVVAGDFAVADFTTKKQVQFIQTTVGANPFASPIIDVSNIVRVNYREWTSVIPALAKNTVDFGTPTSTKDVMLRIAIRTAPTAYEYFANPSAAYTDLTYAGSGTAYAFPILGNFSAGRMIFNVEVPASVHAGSETTLTTAMYNAIVANKTLNAVFKATDSGASGLVLVARHLGVQFDVTSQYSDKSGAVGTVTPTFDITTATSNYIKAISDEKSQRARYGNFNRMYFPMTMTDYAQVGYKYDVLEIVYKHGHPADTGIARAGELNTIKIYFGSSSTALAAAADFATTFGIAIGTDEEQVTDIALQS